MQLSMLLGGAVWRGLTYCWYGYPQCNRGLDLRPVLDNFEIVMRQVAVGGCVSMGIDDLAGKF